MEERPAGRSRGRAAPVNRPQKPPASPHQPQGAWARRPGTSSSGGQQERSEPETRPGGDVGGPPSKGRSVKVPVPQYREQSDAGPSGQAGPPPQAPPPAASGEEVSGAAAAASSAVSGGRGALRGRRAVTADIITRPSHAASKKGTSGTPITLNANYFKILTAPNWCLYQYHVDFCDEDRTIVRKGLLRLHRERLGTYMFDGTLMYTCARLPDVTETNPLELFSERNSDHARIRITVKLVGEMARNDPHYLQLYNIIMRKGLEHLRLQLVGRNYFDALAKIEIREHRFELWPGYLTSIRQHERDVLMCVEITHKVMRQQTLLDILGESRQNAGGRDIQQACKADVIGLTVLTDYNNNTYRIDDIDFDVNPRSTFKKGKGEDARDMTYMEYYQSRYGIAIRNTSQPLLLSRSTNRDRRGGQDEFVHLIPELCRATGLTDSMRSNYKLMAAMAEHTRVNPASRIEKLLGFNRRLMNEPNVAQEFRQWSLGLDQQLVSIQARVLPSEVIKFANGLFTCDEKADWTRCFRDKKLVATNALKDWVVLVPERASRDTQNFCQMLNRAASGMGFIIDQPHVVMMREDRATSYTTHLEEIMSRRNPQLVFCVSLRSRADVYSAIKKKCCVDRPVPSQVMLANKMSSKGAMSIATKVAIQMNCKIGGAPWSVEIPLTGLMVVGYDVCHDPNQRGTDFGAMVASLDKGFARYFSAVSQHTSNEELSNHFGINMIKAVKKFKEINNIYPSRIIIYRDGVGEGQVPFVLEHEVGNIRKSLAQFYGSMDAVKLAVVLVTKRINTRFFYNRRANPPPGTVIDDVVTDPNRYDFFIVAQSVNQGSVSPTAYNVIDDSIGLPVDRMQHLTYKLCHLYFNWSGTVRVPAPCQFAHKLAFLVSQAIHAAPSSHLESLLYFL